ncbi:MAG: hypothetical protein PHD15_05645 [Clostridia bacterium]|nr:hypothetical protein [Clostridia bacterium]MDD4387216.1 hypothetical protein [Clostridia bacterium]
MILYGFIIGITLSIIIFLIFKYMIKRSSSASIHILLIMAMTSTIPCIGISLIIEFFTNGKGNIVMFLDGVMCISFYMLFNLVGSVYILWSIKRQIISKYEESKKSWVNS